MILWDGYGLQSTYSGIGRHAFELARELEKRGVSPRILPSAPRLDPAFSKYTEPRFRPSIFARLKPLALIHSGREVERLFKETKEPIVFHGLSNYNVPELRRSFRKILTVHDLIPLDHPETVSSSLRYFLRYEMPKALHRADHIICVSEWTKSRLLHLFPKVSGKISLIGNGKNPKQNGQRKRSVDDKFQLLTVSRGETYKRLSMLPRLIERLGEGFAWTVVTDEKGREVLGQNQRLNVLTGVSDEALEALWQKTDSYIHPSLWEGYCLPAVRALSSHIPVIHTLGSGIDEVVGKAGLGLHARDDEAEWAEAIKTVREDSIRFEKLAADQWDSLPSWGEVAAQLQQLYDTMRA